MARFSHLEPESKLRRIRRVNGKVIFGESISYHGDTIISLVFPDVLAALKRSIFGGICLRSARFSTLDLKSKSSDAVALPAKPVFCKYIQ